MNDASVSRAKIAWAIGVILAILAAVLVVAAGSRWRNNLRHWLGPKPPPNLLRVEITDARNSQSVIIDNARATNALADGLGNIDAKADPTFTLMSKIGLTLRF